MANESLINLGTELKLELAASSALINDGDFRECDDDDRQPGNDTGYWFGIFEFDTASSSPFSVAATAGAAIHLFEQKINSDGSDAPDVSATYEYDRLWSFPVESGDNTNQQHLTSPPLPINRTGGKYWVQWVDGSGGSASLDAGWELRLTPCTPGTA